MIKSYNELTVGKYVEIRELLKQDLEELDLQVEILGVLNDMSVEDIMRLPLPEYSEYVRMSAFLTEKPKTKADCPKKITINERKYYVVKKAEDLTAAQYIDYQNYMKMNDPDSKLAEILSIFIIPEGKKYGEDYDIAEVVKDIKEYLPIIVGFNICFFFRKKQAESIERILIYLELMTKMWRKRRAKTKEQEKMLEEAEVQMSILRHFLTDGAGYTTSKK